VIGKLRGVVDSVDDEGLVLDVNGVGYLVAASAHTLRSLPRVGEAAELLIETHVREDAIKLYGFLTTSERDWFRLLQSVQGVGAKVALGVLGALKPDELSTAIGRQDKTMMARAPGVGPKLAARLVLELKDNAPALSLAEFGGRSPSAEGASGLPKAAADAILALVGLGYARAQAAAAIARCSAELGEEAQTSALIRAGLKELAQ
jgi:holliday junction DNA helicase RuvA